MQKDTCVEVIILCSERVDQNLASSDRWDQNMVLIRGQKATKLIIPLLDFF